MRTPNQYIRDLGKHVKDQKGVFILYSILRLLVVLIMIRTIILGNYEATVTCLLVLALFFIPSLLEETLKIKIPPLLEGIMYCFIFAAEILGELGHFYTQFPIWDTMLHTLNGFLFAAVGFSTVDILNRTSKNIKLSPLYLTMVAFCFSMTIGVLWEFFECGADIFLHQDMQKDFIVDHFQSVTLDETHSQEVVRVEDITGTVIHTGSGDITINGGYLDIGILDTMKDLLVNFIGAIVFCSAGYAFLKYGESKKAAAKLVSGLTLKPETSAEEDVEAEEEMTE
ncbi:MAG: hypothetical protein IJJ01_05520 [Firmicutes bacterium]|nr:hypothetical protein [Bacillota bacterium]